MKLFNNSRPVILKEGGDARTQLAALEQLRETLEPAAGKKLDADIRAIKAGIIGEERVLYELKNSHTEMYVLQDLFLEHEGLTAQIDFLVITPQRNYVLECKSLYGDITINDRGDFIRKTGAKREGIYSPITQNERHLELIHATRRASRGIAMNLMVDQDFYDVYRSFIVFANPKTILHDSNANPEVKSKIIRADQLIATIRATNAEKGPGHEKSFRFSVRDLAEWFLSQHKDNPVDYTAKYRSMQAQDQRPLCDAKSDDDPVLCPRCGTPMVLRTAKKGAHAGRQFYGCSKYPSCRGIVSIDA